jgi:diguanylate cyclase (GGDEF)-like protein
MQTTTAQNEPGILLVDDDRLTLDALSRALQGMGRLHVAQGGSEALRLMRDEVIDLILMDADLSALNGSLIGEALKADADRAQIPVIYVTSHADQDAESPGGAQGAADFIAKPIRPGVVAARVATQIRLKHATDALRDLALSDGLTGLPNRRAFDATLAREWGRCLRHSEPLSVLMVGVDGFAAYAAQHGRRRGDECLRDLSELLDDCLKRPVDLAARHDEARFAVLLPSTGRAGAAEVAQRILQQASGMGRPQGAGFWHAVGVSVGYSSFDETCDNWVSDGRRTRESAPVSLRPGDIVEAAALALDQARQAGPTGERFVSVYLALAERLAAEPVH